jgi:hypothetical protein
MGEKAGFSAALLTKAGAQPQRASALAGDPVRFGRNDGSLVERRTGNGKSKGKGYADVGVDVRIRVGEGECCW